MNNQTGILFSESDYDTWPAALLSFSLIESALLPSVYDHQPIKEPEKQLDPHTGKDSDSSIDISSLQLNQTKVL